MGWLKLMGKFSGFETPAAPFCNKEWKSAPQHIEDISIVDGRPSSTTKAYSAISLDTPDEALSFIPAEEVMKRTSVEHGGLCKRMPQFTWVLQLRDTSYCSGKHSI